MRDDIFGGLRNALEHGSTLEQAIKSFTSAGYHEGEVREAAKSLEGGTATAALAMQSSPRTNALAAAPRHPQPQPMRQPQAMARTSFEMRRPSQRPSLLIIILSIILLLSITGFIFSLLFKKEIATFLAQFLTG